MTPKATKATILTNDAVISLYDELTRPRVYGEIYRVDMLQSRKIDSFCGKRHRANEQVTCVRRTLL